MILRPEWLESLPNAAVNTYELMSVDIVRVIIKRIEHIGHLSSEDLSKLTSAITYLGADLKEIEKIIAIALGKSESQIDAMFEELALESDNFAKEFYEYRHIEPKIALNDRFLSQEVNYIAEQTKGIGRNLANTMAFKGFDGKYHNLRETYISHIDRAIYEARAGIINFDVAMKRTIGELSKGIQTVNFDVNGKEYHRRLDSQIRMNLMDGINKSNQLLLQYHAKEFNSDGVEISAHPISAPDHVGVQGRQYSNIEFDKMQNGMSCVDYEGHYHAGFKRKIGEWNCRHYVFPIVLGVSKPFYDEKTLDEMKQNSDEKYDLTQKQREMERKLRDLKMRYKALNGLEDTKGLKAEINARQKALRNFCKDNGLEYHIERAKIY